MGQAMTTLELSNLIRESRHDMSLTQQSLGNAISVSRKTINAMENGGIDSISFGTVSAALKAVGYQLYPNAYPRDVKYFDCAGTNLDWMKPIFQLFNEIESVYFMPEKRIGSTYRLAIICQTNFAQLDTKLRDFRPMMELRSNKLLDFFYFTPNNCPPCTKTNLVFSKSTGLENTGDHYDPYNETDPENESKIRLIEQFASQLQSNASLPTRIMAHVINKGNFFHDDHRKLFENEWFIYLTLYPNNLLYQFLTSRNTHLHEICASSPILRTQPIWNPS